MPARISEHLDKIIKARFSTSFMSNAKWRKFFIALDVPEICLQQAYWKFVDLMEEFCDSIPTSDKLMEEFVGDYGPGPFAYKRIEWIELPKVGVPKGFDGVPQKYWQQDIEKAKEILVNSGQFEIETTERGLRIYGYK